MKVAIVSTNDFEGGAARAAFRLAEALQGHPKIKHVDLIVQKKSKKHFFIKSPKRNLEKFIYLLRPHLDKIPLSFCNQTQNELISSNWLSNRTLVQHINKNDYDVVNLHWFNKGFLSLRDLRDIKIPILMTLHDSWIATGGCHLPGECVKFKTGCFDCPRIENNLKFLDPIKLHAKTKTKILKNKNIHYIAVSAWLRDQLKMSAITSDKLVHVISNTLGKSSFKPICTSSARKVLNLRNDKIILGFGAMSADTDRNKGIDYLVQVMNKLEPDRYELLVFGTDNSFPFQNIKQKTTIIGEINDEKLLNIVYNSMDIFLMPSMIESFGQTAAEAMACGKPVCSFRTSGLLDIVTHKSTGFLATAYDVESFVDGINWLATGSRFKNMQAKCLEHVSDHFSEIPIRNKYYSLFENATHI